MDCDRATIDTERFRADVRTARIELNLTQEQLAAQTGYTKNVISDIERGKRSARRMKQVFPGLCESLGLEPEDYARGKKNAVSAATEPALLSKGEN